jgi:glycosyltransferase involved in cell wall biosynthesis
MFFLCMKNRYDAIYVRELERNPGPRLCSKLFNIPLYMEINDLIVPVLLDNGFSPIEVQKVKHNQQLDFKQATGLIVPSVPMREWILDEYGMVPSKVHMILNGTDHGFTDLQDKIDARKKIGLPPDCFCIAFMGTIYDRYDFDSILDAIVISQNEIPNLYFNVIGDGPLLNEIKIKVNELGLSKRTIFTGYVQQEKLGEMLATSDIGLSILNKKYTFRYGPVTTKLSTYASYCLSVIATGFSMEGYPNELNRALLLVPPEDPKALADMIYWLYNHPEERNNYTQALHDYVIKSLSWESVTKQILEIIFHNRKLI